MSTLEDQTVCRGCWEPVSWRQRRHSTEAARWLPLGLDPSPDGTVRVLDDTFARVLTGVDLIEARAKGEHLYLLHRPAASRCPGRG